MNITSFDLISDMHIDHWDPTIELKNQIGPIKNIPFILNQNSNILFVCGDVCDKIEDSVDFLNLISKHYDYVFFVDGNHEHVYKYPYLYNYDFIDNLIKKPNIIYLPNNNSKIIGKTAIIGVSGWWDYNNNNNDDIYKAYTYFNDWIPKLSEDDNKKFIENVSQRSQEEYIILKRELDKYSLDNMVDNIIVLTHTVPLPEFLDHDDLSTGYNSKFEDLLNYNKISHWVFGHTHKPANIVKNNINFICHPRGRPIDTQYEVYNNLTLQLK